MNFHPSRLPAAFALQRMGLPSIGSLVAGVCALLTFAGGVAAGQVLDPTKTQIALPLATAPKIDGKIDADEWSRAGGAAGDFWQISVDSNLEDSLRGGVNGLGSAPADSDDLSFRIYAGYDSENLYVAVRVRDSSLFDDSAEADSKNGSTWEDDSVEVFVDGTNANDPQWVVDHPGGQYVISVNNAYRENEAGNPGYGEKAAWFAKTARTDTGYDAEFRIALKTLGDPKPGGFIGFTVAVNDDDDGGARERQVVWAGVAHQPVTYGNLLLGGRSYSAPKTAPPTVDGTINASEYPGAEEINIDGTTGVFDIPSGDDTATPADLSYKAWIVHDADSIYVAVNVTDDKVSTDSAEAGSENGSTWEDDSVEIFFDPNNSKDAGRGGEPFEGQYVLTANGAWRDSEANNPKFGPANDWFAATAKTATGYAVEFRVKKAALLNPADGTSIGFHLAVNDDDGSNREAQLGWSGRAHSEFTYGTLTLATGGSTPAKVNINRASLAGNNIELAIATGGATGAVVVQKSTGLAPTQWTDLSGVTLTPGAGGVTTAGFTRPVGVIEFYRVIVR